MEIHDIKYERGVNNYTRNNSFGAVVHLFIQEQIKNQKISKRTEFYRVAHHLPRHQVFYKPHREINVAVHEQPVAKKAE